MGSEITIIEPSTDKVAEQGGTLVASARDLTVDDEESHAEAQIMLQDIKAVHTKIVKEIFEEPRTLAHRTWKSFVAAEKKLTDPLDFSRKLLVGKITSYERLEQQRAEEEARRLEELLRKEQEEVAQEAAEAAQEAGYEVEAQEILDSAKHAPEPVVQPQARVSKVSGVTSMTRWSAEVTDLIDLVRYVAENPQWIGLLQPDMKQLNALARAQRKAMALPGVRAVSTSHKSVRA